MPRTMELKFRNFNNGPEDEKMDASLPQAKPQNPNHVPAVNYDESPKSTKREDTRRAAKRNLPEEIRMAQLDVNGFEQRITPLRNALKNSKRRLARLQKLHAKK